MSTVRLLLLLTLDIFSLIKASTPHQISDLLLNIPHQLWTHEDILLIRKHQQQYFGSSTSTIDLSSPSSFKSSNIHLACTSYANGNDLHNYLTTYYPLTSHHPLHISKKSNRICYTLNGYDSSIPLPNSHVTVTSIPHILKLDTQLPQYLENLKQFPSSIPFVLEIGIGLGIQGKGIHDTHTNIANQILTLAKLIQQDPKKFQDHLELFYFTNPQVQLHHRTNQNLQSIIHSKKYSIELLQHLRQTCNFDRLHVLNLRSHITFTTKKVYSDFEPSCYLLLASIATISDHVSHVTGHMQPVSFLPNSAGQGMNNRLLGLESIDSVDYTLAPNATDQNSWCQSYTSTETPYSDIGLDGSNYVVGMIDTGLDDLSCFFIDWSGTETPRTAKYDYDNPITELNRRKVVQYVAWADGEPASGKDHGTWCGGAVVGNCINGVASEYNGLAYNSQITMFDVSVNGGDWLDVPSLYDISLPPAYKAGARVHSNSWGTPKMGSYSSKALDVDQFMVDNPDFLFVVAAGNDGRTGYTSVHSPGVSKNALTVGASAVNHNYLAEFSSIGYDYDQHMIKPNIVTPGQSVTSAGVRLSNQNESCNVEVLSGTSMATPTGAASAVLIRQYFENASFWQKVCNKNYRSCPIVSNFASGLISGALLKAAVIHSGQPMKGTSSGSKSLLPAVNLTTPPDQYQGWGQVKLTNLLPLPASPTFDLYVADQELIISYSIKKYFVQITTISTPLRVTIAWSDPPNLMWATKNLLNDIDLRVVSPTGQLYYGNNIQGDEFNPVERVVVDNPELGIYTVEVVGNFFPLNEEVQYFGIVITSGGLVLESQTTAAVPIDPADVEMSLEEAECNAQSSTSQLVRFQLEDYAAGASWTNLTLSLYDGTTVVNTCNFSPNSVTQNSLYNRIYQCALCLPAGEYLAQLPVNEIPASYRGNVRVAGSCDGMFLSQYQQQGLLNLTNNKECNPCPFNSSRIGVLMMANVTDDDYTEYSWYGEAFYRIVDHKTGYLVASGTLVISDAESDR